MNEQPTVLDRLLQVLRDRKENPPPRSYTTALFAGGLEKIGGKIIEEAGELVEAAAEAGAAGREHLIHETADLIYHVLVLLRHSDVEWQEVETELARRFGVCGLDEKASRKPAE
ncbi:MAG: phosphoribosyl-ATP diphosphatase [Pirellulaceae bacterium]